MARLWLPLHPCHAVLGAPGASAPSTQLAGFSAAAALLSPRASLSRLHTGPHNQPAPLAPSRASGLWKQADKKCRFTKDNKWWSFTSGYYCACTSPSYTLTWEANSACAVAPRAAATDPAACRYSKYNSDGPWTMGYYIGDICYAIGEGFGPTGQTWSGIKGGLGYNSYKVQLLCASAASEWFCAPRHLFTASAF